MDIDKSIPPNRQLQNVFDPELHYGAGDDNALYNIFATWPESFFSSLPKPHGNRGIDEPYWELRQCPIILDDCFRGHGVRRLYTTAIPSPDKLERKRLREQVQMEGAGGCTQPKASFKSALEYAREQAKFDSSLAVELAKHGQVSNPPHMDQNSPSSSPSSSALLTRSGRALTEHEERSDVSDTGSSSHGQPLPIPNPCERPLVS